ncbi:CATRA system-associated protein [Streptomyces sp. NPDC005820]|uniref:CATRA system-associated protein n=1 Tax=Streptomyces sp. NPDC005820 TaxID=3157069 RepID=UPI00340E93CB
MDSDVTSALGQLAAEVEEVLRATCGEDRWLRIADVLDRARSALRPGRVPDAAQVRQLVGELEDLCADLRARRLSEPPVAAPASVQESAHGLVHDIATALTALTGDPAPGAATPASPDSSRSATGQGGATDAGRSA